MKNENFQSIREFSRRGIKSESAIRADLKAGRVPGFYAGSRFVVNSALYLEAIENECRNNAAAAPADSDRH